MNARQPLFLHIGMPKSGSTFLQGLLADNRATLLEHGFVYPEAGREAMFKAALEMAGIPRKWGMTDEEVEGSFARLLEVSRLTGGTAVISHEIFSAATRKEVDRIGEMVADFDLSVVVTIRDLARTFAAQWQERIKNGSEETYALFATKVLASRPVDMESKAHGFWHGHNVPWVLTRWERLVPPERIHVVLTPDRSKGTGALWERFATTIGLPADAIDVSTATSANETLGSAQIALLRDVMTAAKAAPDGLEQPWIAQVGKRWFAQSLLAQAKSPRPVTPADVAAELGEVSELWIERLSGKGYQVHGDLSELRPALPPEGTPHPDDVTAEDQLRGLAPVLAQVLLHERDQRIEVERLRGVVRHLREELAAVPPPPPPTRVQRLRARVSRSGEGSDDG